MKCFPWLLGSHSIKRSKLELLGMMKTCPEKLFFVYEFHGPSAEQGV